MVNGLTAEDPNSSLDPIKRLAPAHSCCPVTSTSTTISWPSNPPSGLSWPEPRSTTLPEATTTFPGGGDLDDAQDWLMVLNDDLLEQFSASMDAFRALREKEEKDG
jgi:hypothetical protein